MDSLYLFPLIIPGLTQAHTFFLAFLMSDVLKIVSELILQIAGTASPAGS